jgi:hypothetical protein
VLACRMEIRSSDMADATEMRTQRWRSKVSGPARGPLQTATDCSIGGPRRLSAGAVIPWRALVAAALLAVLLGAALAKGLGGESSATAARVHSGRPGASWRGAPSVLPAAALGPVSAALGTSARAYRLSASGGGFAAENPAQRLELRFDRSGVQLSSRGLSLGLSLRSVGYGTSRRALAPATPRVSANRVLYARAGLEEWYANGPLGLEQGFRPVLPAGR